MAIDGSLDIYNHQFNKNYVQSYILLQSADAKRKFYKLYTFIVTAAKPINLFNPLLYLETHFGYLLKNTPFSVV